MAEAKVKKNDNENKAYLEGEIIVNNKITPCNDVTQSFDALNILYVKYIISGYIYVYNMWLNINIHRPKQIIDATVGMNWVKPSKLQATALPIIVKDKKNLIAQADHGSGKTGTFAMAMLSIIDYNKTTLQGLILCHSRELAIQTVDVILNLGIYYTKLTVYAGVPGNNPPKPWNAQICVGTPGTLLHKVITRGNLKGFLNDFKILVIDEADEFLKRNETSQQKFRINKFGKKMPIQSRSLCDQMLDIYDRICDNTKPKAFQKLLFSATFPKKVKAMAAKIGQPNAVFIELKKSEVGLANIKLFKINCESNNNNGINNNAHNNNINTENNKFITLVTLMSIGKVGQSIVFVNTIEKAKTLIKKLDNKGFKCSALYGRDMKPVIRDETMSQFREGNTICLIASNVIARGIDVPSVNLVINYEIPIELKSVINSNNNNKKTGLLFDSETFMHRVGRCGRFGARGVCVNLVDNIKDANNLGYILQDFILKCDNLSMNVKDIKKSLLSWLKIDNDN